MSNFGGNDDHFDLAVTDDFIVVTSSKVPVAQTRADALDEEGDIADSAWHGNTAGNLYEASVTYALVGGAGLPAAVKLGQLSVGKVVTGIEIATSNNEWPQVTVSGILGSDALENVKTYNLPSITVLANKKAQVMGVAVTTGKLNSCSLSASCDWAQQNDGDGEPVAFGVANAIATATAQAVATSAAAPVLAAAAGWEVAQDTGIEEPQADWHTASINVEYPLSVAT